MSVITEAELRQRVRQPQNGLQVAVPPGARFSPAARDFISAWQLEIVEERAGPAKPARVDEKPSWDKPGAFPVVLEGEIPKCITCGMPVRGKPDHLTQVDASHFAPKNSDRIRLRGKLDTIQGLCLLVSARARTLNLTHLAGYLSTLAAYCREIMSAEYNDRAAAALAFAGLDEAALHKATHQPQEFTGISHIVPGPEDHEILHWLNFLRCQVRETEVIALDALGAGPPALVVNPSVAHALNRLSSAVYYLELLFKVGRLSGSAAGQGLITDRSSRER